MLESNLDVNGPKDQDSVALLYPNVPLEVSNGLDHSSSAARDMSCALIRGGSGWGDGAI